MRILSGFRYFAITLTLSQRRGNRNGTFFQPPATALIALFLVLLLGAPTWMISAQGIDVHFTDVTDQVGIKFKHVSTPEKKYIVESMSGGVALFDYDNDGYLDIYLVNSLTAD